MKERINALDLFSGIGGNTLALREWVRTVAYCEADKHAQAVLLSRMAAGDIDPAPICTDVTKLDGNELFGVVDLIIAGFPCQDISVAGKGAGLEGGRSGLFYEIVRLAKEIKPTFIFLENVPAIRTRGLDTVIQELTSLRYDCRWTMLSAAEVGAPHKRERWFLLAYSKGNGRGKEPTVNTGRAEGSGTEGGTTGSSIGSEAVADTNGEGLEIWECKSSDHGTEQPTSFGASRWAVEPDVGRVAHGVPQRVDRIKRLGNAVVPEQARQAFLILLKGVSA